MPLPDADTPWHVAQLPTKPPWSGRPLVTQVSGEWQFSQVLELWMCVGDLPVISTPADVRVVPLWQVKQLPSTCAWSTLVVGVQEPVVWHASQTAVDWTCPVPFPWINVPDDVLTEPLWQELHVPTTCVWSTCAADTGAHKEVDTWQASQRAVVWMCAPDLPTAVTLLWQVAQPLVMPV